MGKYFNLKEEKMNLTLNPMGTLTLKVELGIQEVEDEIAKRFPEIFQFVDEEDLEDDDLEEDLEDDDLEEDLEDDDLEEDLEVVVENNEEVVVEKNLTPDFKIFDNMTDKKELAEYAKQFNIILKQNKSLVNMKIDFVNAFNKQ